MYGVRQRSTRAAGALGRRQLPLSIAAASSCRGRGPQLDAAAMKSGSCDLPRIHGSASTPLPHSTRASYCTRSGSRKIAIALKATDSGLLIAAPKNLRNSG